MIHSRLLIIPCIAATSLYGQTQSKEASEKLFTGSLYTRAAISYQYAENYHSGYNSSASAVFDSFDGEYSFVNYTLDLVYISKSGFYVGTGLYSSSAKVNTTLGVPNTDSDIELREIPLAVGYNQNFDSVRLRYEARYVFNVDDDFKDGSVASANILPVTDGSDSLTLSVKAKTDLAGFEHSLLFGYQMFEEDVSHPLYPNFSLGDRFIVDYEIAKVIQDVRISVGHLYSQSQRTEGTPGFNGTAYLTEKPRSAEVRATVAYKFTPRFLLDGGLKYIYDGKDAPEEKTVYLGAAYIF